MRPGWTAAALTAAALVLASCAAADAEQAARRHELVSHGAVTLDVVVEGAGPPVVLLPSLGRDSLDYDEVAAGLAGKGFRVLRPQPRGIGASTGPMDGLTLHDYADDVAAVIEQQDAGPAVLVGHAYGHFVARMTAADHPQLVRGVVVAAGAARTYPDSLSAMVAVAADPARPEAERLTALRGAFFAPGNDPTVWLTGWHPDVRAVQKAASDRTDKDSWWRVAPSPILDLQAGDDPWRPAATRTELTDEFGDVVSVAVVPKSSHALLPEQPAAVVDAITTWMRTLS